jgi:hypothetical protein
MDERSVLPPTWQIPKSLRQRVGERPGRQRVIFEEGHLLLVLHQPPKAGEMQRRGRFFWRKPDGSWTASDSGDGPSVLTRHLADYSAALQQYELQEERASSASEYFAVIEGVQPLLRSTTHLHQVLQEARKLVPEDRGLINYRDQAYDLERTADLLYVAAKNGLDFEIARRSEEEAHASRKMARAAHRLNVLVALFFPLATLCAVLSVNLDESLARPMELGVLVVGGMVFGALLAVFVTRRK